MTPPVAVAKVTVSMPVPPFRASSPATPFTVSLPAAPFRSLAPALPVNVSLPAPPTRFSDAAQRVGPLAGGRCPQLRFTVTSPGAAE